MRRFKSSQAKRLAHRTHHEYIDRMIRIAPLFASHKPCEYQLIADAETSRKRHQFISLFAVSRQHKRHLFVATERPSSCAHKVRQSFLYRQSPDRPDNRVAILFEVLEIAIGTLVVLVRRQIC